ALRSAAEYVRARCVGENRTFSPTQSLTWLQSRSSGRMAPPPSQPHAAASAAPAPARPNFTNARRSTPGVWAPRRLRLSVSVMARKAASVPPRDHGPQRSGVHDEHEDHVHDREPHEDPHDPEMPVARRLKSTQQRRQPAQLGRFVDREAGEHRERAQHDHTRVRKLLERVVLTLRWMLPAEMEVVLRHRERARNVPRAEQQGAPLAAPYEVREVQETESDERPCQREVPVERAREPAAEPA